MKRAEIRTDSDSFSVARSTDEHAEILAELAAIERGIDAADVRALWAAALFGWPAPHLESRVESLRALRDRVGQDATVRKSERAA